MGTLKNLFVNTRVNFIRSLAFLFCIVFLSSSCSKPKKTDDFSTAAYLTAVNAIPKTNPVDFFIDNTRANAQLIPFGEGLDYFVVAPGQRKIDITFGNVVSVATDNINIDAAKYYSVYFVGKMPYEFVVTSDDRASLPPQGKAKVRFINLSPDAPNMDFGVMGGATLFADQAYKSNSDFINIDSNNLNLVVRQAGSSTVKASKIDIFFEAGGIYTVVVIGTWNASSSDPKIEIKVVKNK